MYMYGRGAMLGATTTTATVAAVTLPSTGGNMVVTLAISVASGLVMWGILYTRANLAK